MTATTLLTQHLPGQVLETHQDCPLGGRRVDVGGDGTAADVDGAPRAGARASLWLALDVEVAS